MTPTVCGKSKKGTPFSPYTLCSYEFTVSFGFGQITSFTEAPFTAYKRAAENLYVGNIKIGWSLISDAKVA